MFWMANMMVIGSYNKSLLTVNFSQREGTDNDLIVFGFYTQNEMPLVIFVLLGVNILSITFFQRYHRALMLVSAVKMYCSATTLSSSATFPPLSLILSASLDGSTQRAAATWGVKVFLVIFGNFIP